MVKILHFIIPIITLTCFPAIAEEITCPATIKIEEKIVKEVDGWQGSNPSGRDHMLQYISIGDVYGASFREDKATVTKGVEKDTWELSDPDIPYAIVCHYFTTDIVLFRPISEKKRICESYSEVRSWQPYKFLRMTCSK